MNKRKLHMRRARRTRSNIGKDRARLSVYRSLQHIYAQIIDDSSGKTLVSFSTKEKDIKGTGIEKAYEVGREIAKRAKKNKITTVVFDRGGYRYHGRVKAVAEGAREGGLEL